MKAVGFYQTGSIDRDDALLDIELPIPEPGPRDLLVRIEAVSVNPVDCKVRTGTPPEAGEAKIPGYDAAGTVEAVGRDVTLFKPGDAVFYAGDISKPGTNAEYQRVDERLVGRKPQTLNWAEAAALPLTAITAWELLFDRLGVPYGKRTSGETLLIINGAGGVGSMLIQIARRLTGLTVVASASREASLQWCRSLGAHHVINHREPISEGLAHAGLGQPKYVAVLTDPEPYREQIAELIAPQGSLGLIVNQGHFDVSKFMTKSVTVAWELMFTRALYQTPDMVEQHHLLNEIAELVDAGVLRTTLTETLGTINAANLKMAHIKQESGSTIGKTVLTGFSP